MRGVGLRTVQELLGHKTIAMTLRYTHLLQEHLHEAVGMIDLGFGGSHADHVDGHHGWSDGRGGHQGRPANLWERGARKVEEPIGSKSRGRKNGTT
jgi:hypothetical protein